MPSDNIHPIDFLNSVPPPLTVALLKLAPCVSFIRNVIQIGTWSTPTWYHSWLALAAWWATCLLLDGILRRFLPLVIFGLVAILHWPRKQCTESPPLTESTLQNVITDMTIIQSTLPTSLPAPSLSTSEAFRAAMILFIPYILFSFVVSLRTVIALAGSVLLTWRAPWAIVVRATIWRSAWFRWSAYKIWAFLINEPLPSPVMSPPPATTSTEAVQSIRFLFTIYENQRWWMGLDWTAALMPAERPSWCSATLQPMTPPNAFTLPESTTLYLPDGKGGRLKRTATWRWEEPEWRVLVHKDGAPVSRVERPFSTVKDEGQSSSLLLKAAGRRQDIQSESSKTVVDIPDDHSEDLTDTKDDEIFTDPDGWVYGDNKWENPSSKGGLTKYTRHRRWTRIAIVFEIVEPASPGDIGIEKNELAPPPVKPTLEATKHRQEAKLISEDIPESPLRQRLQNALKSPAPS